jgi:hypothetical protein
MEHMTMIYAAVSAYVGTVRLDVGGAAPLRDLTPDGARALARALKLHAEQAEVLAAHDDPRNAALGNRHSRLTLEERSAAA